MAATVHFLLVYSYDEERLVERREFRDAIEATEAYNEAERAYRDKPRYEIVLVGSDSIESIMKTHGHYFMTSDDSMFSRLLTNTLRSS